MFRISIPSMLGWLTLIGLLALGAQPAVAGPATITSLDDKCLDVFQSNFAEGTPVVLFRCTGNRNQLFNLVVTSVGYKEFSLRAEVTESLCLMPSTETPAPLDPVVLGPCDDPRAEWIFSLLGPDGVWAHQESGLCLDVLGGSSDDLTPLVVFGCTGNQNQFFTINEVNITPPALGLPGALIGNGGKCLDVLGSDAAAGEIVLFRCTGNANQTWTTELSEGSLRFRGLDDQCLRAGDSMANGLPRAELGSCNDAAARWDLAQAGAAPAFGLENLATGTCLDVLGASTDDQTPIVLFGCRNAQNQSWRFEPRQVAGRCIPSPSRLCLNDGRFAVEVDWLDFAGRRGGGTALPLQADDSGLFWFFNANNIEFLVKVLDACTSASNRFWVFAAATTNVEYTLTVTDTETGVSRSYFNPLGQSAAAITDTRAFDTCP